MKGNKELTLNEYQEKAMTTCLPSSRNFAYMFMNLVGEVGEFSSKVAKGIRKEKVQIGYGCKGKFAPNIFMVSDSFEPKKDGAIGEEMQKELGDILWQLSGLCSVMGWELKDIAQMNLDKLASRKARGVIDGSGDNR